MSIGSTFRHAARSMLVGFASLFGFGEADRHFSEPPAIFQPTTEEWAASSDDEPDR